MNFRVCVFCSASSTIDRRILEAAHEFSTGLARHGWTLVYGGGAAGLMGHFANCTLEQGGQVIGIIPACLHEQREIAHLGLTRLEVVADLFERKRRMLEESDAFVIFPGGWGTLDEAMEVLTWKVLGQIDKPIYFVNLNGFWNKQLEFFKDLASQGMVRPEAFAVYSVTATVPETLVALAGHASRWNR